MADLFDMKLRSLRRDRSARMGAGLFLLERAFDDCLERLTLIGRRFARTLLIGCPDPTWVERLHHVTDELDCRDPGTSFARSAGGKAIVEDGWEPTPHAYDMVLAVGTLDTVNNLPLALQLIRFALAPDGLFIGALSGGETLPRLRAAMRAGDAVSNGAAPRVHPRIEPSALSPLLADAGFLNAVVDVDRVDVSYPSLERLVGDLRAMGATNILDARGTALTRSQRDAAARAFADAGENGRTTETFEILHFAAWTPASG
jgi:hypothetical protein